MTQIESTLPLTSPLRIKPILAELKPEVNKEFFAWLDKVIRTNVSNPDEQVRVLDELKIIFPEEIRGRVITLYRDGISEAEKERIRQHPDSMPTSETSTPNYLVEEVDKEIARNNPDSNFAIGLARNPTYKVEDFDKEWVQEHAHLRFAYELVENPNYPVEEVDKEIARANPKSSFANSLLKNPGYVVEEIDKQLGRAYSQTTFAKLVIQKLAANAVV